MIAHYLAIIGDYDEKQQCGWHGECRDAIDKNDDVYQRRIRNHSQPPAVHAEPSETIPRAGALSVYNFDVPDAPTWQRSAR